MQELDTAYRYDSMNRLVEERRVTDGDRYSYDPAGNRLKKQHYIYSRENAIGMAADAAGRGIIDGEEVYCYNERNELTEKKTLSAVTEYLYDENGSLVNEKEGSKSASYQYDLLNRQIYVKTLDGREQENFYDGEGLRAGIKEAGSVSVFVFKDGESLAECNGDGVPVRRNLQGAGLSYAQTMNDGEYHAYHQDEQGSTAYITGNAGTVVENCYAYDAFGNMLESREIIDNRILYTGQQYDQETGQYYLRARFYNPAVGRFMQEDSYRGDGLNLYAYCGTNPVIYYDPSGHAASKKCKLGDQANYNGQESAGEGGNASEHMLGAKGTQVSSKTTWQNGKTERIDVENPLPGERSGQIHYHDANNNKYYYDVNNNLFYNQRTSELAPKNIQKLLKDNNFMKGIEKALKVLGG